MEVRKEFDERTGFIYLQWVLNKYCKGLGHRERGRRKWENCINCGCLVRHCEWVVVNTLLALYR